MPKPISLTRPLRELRSEVEQLKQETQSDTVRKAAYTKGLHLADFIEQVIKLEYESRIDGSIITVLPKFQREICVYLEDWHQYPNLALFAARNSGKSQIGTIEYATWLIASNPELKGIIISQSALQAQASVRAISTNLTNMGLRPDRPIKWANNEFIVDRKGSGKDPTLCAAGLETNITGKHVDYAILDDAVNDKNSDTEEQREIFRAWYDGPFKPIMNPGGRKIVIGTLWNPADFHNEIINKYSDAEPPKGIGKNGFHILKYPCYDPKDPQNTLLWPERLTFEFLEEQRLSDTQGGVFFQAQYLLDCGGLLGLRFKPEWITKNLYTDLPSGLRMMMACDLATGKHRDRFAICVVGRDANNVLYVVDYLVADLTFPDQVEAVKTMYSKYPTIQVGLEDTNYQVALSQQLLKTTNLPIRPVPATGDKQARITMMTPSLELGKIRLPAKKNRAGEWEYPTWYQSFMNEYLVFPKEGAHDDMLDALYYAWMMSNRSSDDMKWSSVASKGKMGSNVILDSNGLRV